MHDGENPSAGYYPDPDDSRVQRWWDGTSWAVPPSGLVATAPPPIDTEPPPPTTNQYAMSSMALSIGWIFFIGSVLGVICGHVAMAQIRASGGRQIGRGSAMIGLIVGYIGLASAFFLALILAN